MRFILNNLAIGSYEDALAPPSTITALLNVAREKDIETEHLYHKVPIIDMQPIPSDQMKEAVEWIREHVSQNNILVFCNAGIGRSPSVTIGYLCCFLRYSFGDAVEFVARRKPDISVLLGLIKTIEEVKSNISQR
ncbi:MAG: dual specificity protein phosphatase [archaeon]|nr:dual specificity protein phosphatase [archaeon]